MANEGDISVRIQVTKSNLKIRKDDTFRFDLTGTRYASGAQNIGTTAETLTLTDVGTPGVAYFKNLSTTNYVEIGREVSATFYGVIKLKPGEIGLCRLATSSLYARANTAAVDLEIIVVED